MSVYLRDLVERALSSAAGAALAVLGAGVVDVLTVDWANVGAIALGAAVVSVLKGLVARNVGDHESAALRR